MKKQAGKVSINLRIDAFQLEALDKTAKNEHTTRSQLIRTAIKWYLNPEIRALSNDDYLSKTIKYRRSLAAQNKRLKEIGDEIDVYDT